MNIGIVGGGSIGLLFAGYLVKCGHVVTVYTRTAEQAVMLKQGVTLQVDSTVYDLTIQSKQVNESIGLHDMVILTVKQYQLPTLLPIIESIPHTVPLLFVQNGMGHLSLIEKLMHHHIYLGVVEHGSMKESNVKIHHTGIGKTKVAIYKGEGSSLHKLISAYRLEQFLFEYCDDWYSMLIDKLVVNAMINPLTAILKVENGQLISNPSFFMLLEQLYLEIIEILKPEDKARWLKNVISVCEKTAQNRSSMLRDIEQLRETEVEGILGYLRTLPTCSNNKAPLLNFLYHAVKGLEG